MAAQSDRERKRGKSTRHSDGIPSFPPRGVTFGTKSPVMWAALSGTGRLTEAKYSRPAKSTAHVGWGHSGMTHSYTHRETGTHTHKVYTVQTQNFLKNISPVRPSLATVQICEETFRCKTSKEINILSFLAALGSVCGTGERVPAGIACLARLSLVTDRVCVGSLCFHLPSGQPARPNKTLYSLFQEPFLCEIALYLVPWKGLCQYFNNHLVTVNYAGQTNKHYLLQFVWCCDRWWRSAFCIFAWNISLCLSWAP